MFELSDEYLSELGVMNMPEPGKSNLIKNIKSMIQSRVIIKLADKMTEEKADELERIGQSPDEARAWLTNNLPKFESSPEFEQFKSYISDGDPVTLFAQSKWFDVNLPAYPGVLQQTLDEVKLELKTVAGRVI